MGFIFTSFSGNPMLPQASVAQGIIGTQDAVTGQYYEGKPYNWVNFEGQNPRHPSETMREVTSYELKTMEGARR